MRNIIYLSVFLINSCCQIPFNKLMVKQDFSTKGKQDAIFKGKSIVCESKQLKVIIYPNVKDGKKELEICIINNSDASILVGNNWQQSVDGKNLNLLSTPDFNLHTGMGFTYLKKKKSANLFMDIESQIDIVDFSFYIINDFQKYLQSAGITENEFEVNCKKRIMNIWSAIKSYPNEGYSRLSINNVKFYPNKGQVFYSIEDY